MWANAEDAREIDTYIAKYFLPKRSFPYIHEPQWTFRSVTDVETKRQ